MKAIALLLTVLTGFSGLVYEVTWQKCLSILLGSHSEAMVAVLAIFLGGLSLGYNLFARITRWRLRRAEQEGRAPRLLLLYGFVEAAIGLHALLFPTLFEHARSLSLALPHLSDGVAFGIDVGLTALLIGPPTVLMGGTIPVLTQALARSLPEATRVHAHVYGFNTAGAFAGALAAGFVLVPWLGLEGVLFWMGLLNLSAGVLFALLDVRRHGRSAGLPAEEAQGRTSVRFAAYALIALLLGFAMLTTQTVFIRIGGLSLGASHFTFAMVVAVFVLCIALGSFVVSALPRIPRAALPVTLWLLAGLLLLLYFELENAPYYAHLVRVQFGTNEGDFYPYYLTVFAGILAVLALPVGLGGAALPLLFHDLRGEMKDLGAVAGRLYSWNTVGNLLGALFGGYLLLLWMDLHHVYRVALGALALAAALPTALRAAPWARWGAGFFAVAALAAIATLPSWEPRRLSAGLFREREPQPLTGVGADLFFSRYDRASLHFYSDGPTATVAVGSVPDRRGGKSGRSIIVNGKNDGSTNLDYPTMALAGLLPCLLSDAPCERTFVIGYGTGVTAGHLAVLESTREVVVAEISRGVLEAAPLFDFANAGASDHPQIALVRSDAYRALLRSDGGFDAIVSEPSNPWVTGVEMLYSREFLTAARDRLRPGGVYVQWFHLYETNQATVELVLRTYREVFERTAIWYTRGPDILLLGFESPEGGGRLETLLRRTKRADFAAGLRRAGIPSVPALLAHEILPPGSLQELELEGPLHTLLHPRLSHRAARAFFKGGRAELPSAASAMATSEARSLLEQLRRSHPGALGELSRLHMALELCETLRPRCATTLAWWGVQVPDSQRRAELLKRLRRRRRTEDLLLPETLETLRALYGDESSMAPRYSYEEAMRATELFETHYLATIPFGRAELSEVWARCRDAQGRCATGRRRAEGRIGRLPPPEAPTARLERSPTSRVAAP